MGNNYEIERKFLIKKIPLNIEQYSKLEIKQAYLSYKNPSIRIRSSNNKYYITSKDGVGLKRIEKEKEIDSDMFNILEALIISKFITKTRYIIPYNNKKIELDFFHDDLEGLVLGEIEFISLEEANMFKIPDWFDNEVTDDIKYTNSYLAETGLK